MSVTMIISASRRTDIPAFYGDWFTNRLQEGFVMVRNPVNPRQITRVDLNREAVDGIVFVTKNPAPFLDKLKFLQDYPYYFHFTLNPYDREIETNLPLKQELIETFLTLSERLGRKRVIWRYDPILLTDRISKQYHFEHFEFLTSQLSPYTNRCTISFLDFYRKTVRNMASIKPLPLNTDQMTDLAAGLAGIARKYQLPLVTCCEQIDLSPWGIDHGQCIDGRLLSDISGRPIKHRPAKGQRPNCGCVESIDIGAYDTCRHFCLYCYANSHRHAVERNWARLDLHSPLLCENGAPLEVERQLKEIDPQLSLFD